VDAVKVGLGGIYCTTRVVSGQAYRDHGHRGLHHVDDEHGVPIIADWGFAIRAT
jgi:hypothetical protein